MSVLQSRKWLRIELITLACFHLALGLVLGFAPAQQVVTATSVNAFKVMPDVFSIEEARALWFGAFVVAAVFICLLAWRLSLPMQFMAWGTALYVDGTWLAAYAAPLLDGKGSAVGSVVFPALIAWSLFALIRVAQSNGG